MNVFITGINSFVGKKLLLKFKAYKNINIYGCDINPKKSRNIILADIRKKNFYKLLPKNLDAIIHLAAISRDQDCSRDLSNCYLTNVIGTLNVINAAKYLKIKKIIFASTEWVYPSKLASKSANENSLIDYLSLNSDYAKSKLISEIHLRNFYDLNKDYDVSILRFGIIYGERISNWSAVESIFNNIKNNNTITVGSLKTARKFIHIDDICEGIIKSLKLKRFNIINLQGSKLINLKYLAELSQKILKKKVIVLEKNKKNLSIRNILCNKSNKKINFKPKISLLNGLIKFNKYLDNKKIYF